MKVYLHRLETFVPEHASSQDVIAQLFGKWSGDPAAARIIRHVFHRTGISRRHSVIPDFTQPGQATIFREDAIGQLIEPTTQDRNRCYAKHAGSICVELSRRLVDGKTGFTAADVTHVITVSCTGFVNPGPDCNIVTELGLAPTVERYHLGFMGCYAALPALRMARQFCLAQPDAVVLVVSLELCSLHMRTKSDADSVLGNALFSDGAAAALVSALPPTGDQPVFALDHFASALAAEGKGDMAWEIGNHGFNLVLSSYVPDVIEANVTRIVNGLLAPHGLSPTDVRFWAIHPGGKSILDKVEKSLALEAWQIAPSREVLRDYGNMSSATVLFVLQRLLTFPEVEPCTVATMAFGPGLTIDCGLLQLVPARKPAEIRKPALVVAGV